MARAKKTREDASLEDSEVDSISYTTAYKTDPQANKIPAPGEVSHWQKNSSSISRK